MKKYPSKVYIQIENEDGEIISPEDMERCEVTWCQDRIHKSDLVYYSRKQKNSHPGNWKGEKASYSSIHKWVIYHYGKPNKCDDCKTVKSKIFHWANISGEYKRDIKDWKRLCIKCHRIFDDTRFPRGENHFRAKLTNQQVLEIREKYIPMKYGSERLSKEFGVNKATIINIVKRRSWKHI